MGQIFITTALPEVWWPFFLVPIILAIKDRQKPMAIYDEEAKKLAIKDKLFDKPEVKLPKNIFGNKIAKRREISAENS